MSRHRVEAALLSIVCGAALSLPYPAQANPEAETAQSSSEVALTVRLVQAAPFGGISSGAMGTTAGAAASVAPFTLAWHIGNWAFGGGFNLGRISSSQQTGAGESGQAFTVLWMSPEVTYVLVGSSESRAQWHVAGSLHLGLGSQSYDPAGGTSTSQSVSGMGLGFASGLRARVAPGFALGAEIGVARDSVSLHPDGPGNDSSFAALGFYGALTATASLPL